MSDVGRESLSEVIAEAIEARLLDVHVSMPGQIQKYDPTTGMADIQPCYKTAWSDGTVTPLPVITNVPVGFPRALKAYLHLPIKSGDYCQILFSERSIDLWLSQGGVVDPGDPRKHHLSDAIAIPGAWPLTAKLTPVNGDDLIMANDKAVVQLQAGGKFLFKGASDELMDLLVQVVDLLTQVQTTTLMGPQPFMPQYITQLQTLKSKLSGLKGS